MPEEYVRQPCACRPTGRHGQDGLKVADFGLAQLATGVIGSKAAGGTLVYQPPETLSGAEPTPASDVYALGLILYEMLAGENPLDHVQLQAVAEGGRSSEGRSPSGRASSAASMSGTAREDHRPCSRANITTSC